MGPGKELARRDTSRVMGRKWQLMIALDQI